MSQKIFGQMELTKQEMKVAQLVSVGYSDKEAADALHISTRTVVNHKQNIFEKLGISKATELVAWFWWMKFAKSFDLNELKKQVVAMFFLFCMLTSTVDFDHNQWRQQRSRRARTERYLKI